MRKSRTILLSIKPRYANNILTGVKKVELRRSFPVLEAGDCVILYASSPKKAVIGSFIVDHTIAKHPSLLWEEVKYLSGVTEGEFNRYYNDCLIGHAIFIKDIRRYTVEIPYEQLPCKPTQSFRYLNEDAVGLISQIAW